MVDAEGKPRYKYIVEGANLFFTQQARLNLEKRKVILFKDSSANKGEQMLDSLTGKGAF
jgi:glutamate dehydrogenase